MKGKNGLVHCKIFQNVIKDAALTNFQQAKELEHQKKIHFSPKHQFYRNTKALIYEIIISYFTFIRVIFPSLQDYCTAER